MYELQVLKPFEADTYITCTRSANSCNMLTQDVVKVREKCVNDIVEQNGGSWAPSQNTKETIQQSVSFPIVCM